MNDEHDSRSASRRDLLRLASLASLAASAPAAPQQPATRAAASMSGVPFEVREKVRLGVIGTGGRGNALIDNFAAMPEVRVAALCDVVRDKVLATQARLERAGKLPTAPGLYTDGDHAFENLVKRDDLDLVVVATPWIWHTPMALAAMKAGKHVAVEVPAARTIEDCWKLVDTSESTRRHCIQLENCCYGYNELMVLRCGPQHPPAGARAVDGGGRACPLLAWRADAKRRRRGRVAAGRPGGIGQGSGDPATPVRPDRRVLHGGAVDDGGGHGGGPVLAGVARVRPRAGRLGRDLHQPAIRLQRSSQPAPVPPPMSWTSSRP